MISPRDGARYGVFLCGATGRCCGNPLIARDVAIAQASHFRKGVSIGSE
jgi:hypothetical protein